MQKAIEQFSKIFLEKTKNKELLIISHHDTDGITSAAIFSKCLKKLDKKFSIKIVKQLEPKFIQELPKNKTLIFLDLASSSLEELKKLPSDIFIIDHHEMNEKKIPPNICLINHHLFNAETMSASCITYLVAKQLLKENKDLANLAIIGLVGDRLDRNIGKLVNTIIKDAETTVKKGILLYPSTRPLNKTLEYTSNPFIPGVTGDSLGAISLLRESGIPLTNKGYKSLIELTEDEMKKLVTSIVLKIPNKDNMNFIGNLFLVKFFNRLEDARELSALINACSRMGFSEISLLFCMGNKKAKEKAEKIYVQYKQHIIDALKYVNTNSKIEGKQYIIINAKDNIKDTIIGTIASILSSSAIYEEGKIIVAMAYNKDKIKVSARISGERKNENKNLKEIMDSILQNIEGGISGGHKFAAGCLISKDYEEIFIEAVKKKLDIEMIKI